MPVNLIMCKNKLARGCYYVTTILHRNGNARDLLMQIYLKSFNKMYLNVLEILCCRSPNRENTFDACSKL